MKKFLSVIVFVVTLAALIMAGAFLRVYERYREPGPLTAPTMFMVERGQGVSVIAQNLMRQKIIGAGGDVDVLLFQSAVRLGGWQAELKAGEYEFPAHISMADIIGKMVRGDVFQRRITVREGLTSWQVIKIINETPDLSGDPVVTIPAEGMLLPETYSFVKGDTRQAKLEEMQKAMSEALDRIWGERAEDTPALSKAEALILASIVEKETGVASERARIAGVFLNRLKRGIPLQSDPTVIYAITGGKIQDNGMGPLGRRLLRDDLDFESPYNTYKHAGLPPGPICNPGVDAVKAVLNPEKHNYIYFVADGTGGHVFAETLDEHNRNVEKWRQARRVRGN